MGSYQVINATGKAIARFLFEGDAEAYIEIITRNFGGHLTDAVKYRVEFSPQEV